VSIIGWILLGLFAGIIARALVRGPGPHGLILTTVLGVVGALAGGFVAKALGLGDPIDTFFDLSTWVAAVIGSVALLLLYRAFVTRGRRRRTAFWNV
jgi:uncharacterized membrane protein YeaQ/YmgE (transglycosylase-associated protein family)